MGQGGKSGGFVPGIAGGIESRLTKTRFGKTIKAMLEPPRKFTPLNLPPQPERSWPVNGVQPIGAPQPTETPQAVDASRPADTTQASALDAAATLTQEAEAALLKQIPEILQQDFVARNFTSVDLRILDQSEVTELIQRIVDFIETEMAQSPQPPSVGILILGQIPREKLVAELTKILPGMIASGELGLPITDERSWWPGIQVYLEGTIFKKQAELLAGQSIAQIVEQCLIEIGRNEFGGWMDKLLEEALRGDKSGADTARNNLLPSIKKRNLVLTELYEKHFQLLQQILTEQLTINWHDTLWRNYADRLAYTLIAKYAPTLNLKTPIAESLIPNEEKGALLQVVAELNANPRLQGEVLMSLSHQASSNMGVAMEFIDTAMREIIAQWGNGSPDWPETKPPELAEVP